MNGLTIKHLRYFVALAEYEHFAKAADACAISQPALSLQMKQLEDLMGAPLLEKVGRNVRLTGLGRLVASRAREILRSVSDIGELARASRKEMSGPLRLGVIPTVAPYLLPAVVRKIAARFPKVEFDLRETMTPKLIDELKEGEIDAGIVALPIADPAFTEVNLFAENFVLVRHESEKGLPPPTGRSLGRMELLLLEEGHCFRDQALEYCGIQNVSALKTMKGNSLTTLVQMVGSGLGVTLIPEMAANIEAGSAPVVFSRLRDPEPSRTVGMIWRKTNPMHDHFLLIAGLVRDAAMAMSNGNA